MSGFNKWSIFILVICVSILLYALSYNNLFRSEKLFENAKSAAVVKVQKKSFNSASAAKGFFANIFSINKILRENDQLKKENHILKAKMLNFEIYGRENKQLKELLGLDSKNSHNKIACQVIGRSPDSWFSAVYIDKGRKHKITQGSIVINNDGLVGKIDEVSDTYSRVILAVNNDFIIPCRLLKTNDTGLLYGYNGREYIMKYIDVHAKVAPGDVVLLSELNTVPGNIVAGKIKQVIGSEDYMYKEFIVEPSVKLSSLQYLYVFRK